MDRHFCRAALVLVGAFATMPGCTSSRPAGAQPALGLRHPLEDVLRLDGAATIAQAPPIASVLAQLDDPDPNARARAAFALGQSGRAAVLDPLIAVLEDGDPYVRRAAAHAVYLLARNSQPRERLILRKRASEAFRWQIQKEPVAWVKAALFEVLGWTGSEGDAAFLEERFAGDDGVFALAAWARLARRGELEPPRARALIPLLFHPDTERRRLAAWAAIPLYVPGNLEVDRVIDFVGSRDLDAEVRAWATRALGQYSVATRQELFLSRFLHDDVPVRIEAGRALAVSGKWSASREASVLAKVWPGQARARGALAKPSFVQPLLAGLEALSAHADAPMVHELADSVISDLSELLHAPELPLTPNEAQVLDLVQCAAARLWDLGVGRVEETPTCGLARSDRLNTFWRRNEVIRTIAQLEGPPEWKVILLRRYLTDRDPHTRAAAIAALARVKHHSAAIAVERALTDPDGQVFVAALSAAGRLVELFEDAELLADQVARRMQQADLQRSPDLMCQALQLLRRIDRGVASETAISLLETHNRDLESCVRNALELSTLAWTNSDRGLLPTVNPAGATGEEGSERHSVAGAAEAQNKGPQVVLVTEGGSAVLQLNPNAAPRTVSYFLARVADGSYRHAVIARAVGNELVETEALPLVAPPVPEELSTFLPRTGVAYLARGVASGRAPLVISLAPQLDFEQDLSPFAYVTEGMELLTRLLPGDRIKALYIRRQVQ